MKTVTDTVTVEKRTEARLVSFPEQERKSKMADQETSDTAMVLTTNWYTVSKRLLPVKLFFFFFIAGMCYSMNSLGLWEYSNLIFLLFSQVSNHQLHLYIE